MGEPRPLFEASEYNVLALSLSWPMIAVDSGLVQHPHGPTARSVILSVFPPNLRLGKNDPIFRSLRFRLC